jgi:hypothetical protein
LTVPRARKPVAGFRWQVGDVFPQHVHEKEFCQSCEQRLTTGPVIHGLVDPQMRAPGLVELALP